MVGATSISSQDSLVQWLSDLMEPAQRTAAIVRISAALEIETFLILLPDPELGKLLVAPGFPQTVPDRKTWQEFLRFPANEKFRRGVVPWPDAINSMPALGVALRQGSVLVLLGGRPNEDVVDDFASLVSLVLPGLAGERTAASHAVQLQLARDATRESSALAASLDEARRAAQAEIAARKRAEEELRQARDELAAVNQELEVRVRDRTEKLRETISELEAFSYTVSHDLRAPLRAMYSYATALMDDAADKLRPEQADYVKRIGRAAERLDRLIQDVLRYTRVSRAEIVLEPISLEPLLREIIVEQPLLHALAENIEVRSPMPRVLGNEMLLGQCFSNLLLNAAKFVGPGVTPRVRVRTERRERRVRVWIEDNGIGIADEHKARLFGMFERLHPQGAFEGNGIGLAIVKRAVSRLGGEVGVESAANAGSRFWMDLQPA